jgi:putative ABC transport system permease protein
MKSLKKFLNARERPLAWAQISHQKTRMGVAMGGIAFANVLIFMQLGFVNLFAGGATLLPENLRGDLFVLNPESKHIGANTFDRTRLYQAAAFDGIVSVDPVYISNGNWAYSKEQVSYGTRVFAYNPKVKIFDMPELNSQQLKLSEPFTFLFDRLSRPELGPIPEKFAANSQASAFLNNRQVLVNGLFSLGSSFFLGEGNVVTSDSTYAEIFGTAALNNVAIGIIHVRPGTDLLGLKKGIEKHVPGLVALTAPELKAKELKFQDENPTSVIFGFGTVMGFVVGVAIVYQVLYSDVSDHLAEYATLKAIGYSGRSLLLVVFQEAALLAVLGYIPGFIATIGMYRVLTVLTRLELLMQLELALMVFALTLVMCLISAAIASTKLHSADPADVF